MKRRFSAGALLTLSGLLATYCAISEPDAAADSGSTTGANTSSSDGGGEGGSLPASADGGGLTSPEGGVASSDAGTVDPHRLQDAVYIEQQRAEKAASVAAAEAAVERAKQQLVSMNQILAGYRANKKKQGETKALLDAAKPEEKAALRTALDTLDAAVLEKKNQAIALYPKLEQDAANDGLDGALAALRVDLGKAEDDLADRRKEKSDLEATIRKSSEGSIDFVDRLALARKARCQTAYCFGKGGSEYAVEPMLELPIGTSFSFGDGALGRFNNATELSIQFTAGVRFWLLNDLVSLSMFFGKPIYSGDVKIRVPGSNYEHPTTAIRRIGPSFALGLFGDILFIGGGFDQLRNGSTSSSSDSNYAPNQVLSRSVTITVGLAPFAAVRNGAGMLTGGTH